MNKISVSIAVAAAFLITGCATTYNYNNKSYSSTEAVYKAQAQLLDDGIEYVRVRTHQISGSVLIITPSKSLIAERGVDARGIGKKSGVDFVSTLLDNDYKGFSKALAHSSLFEKVVSEVNDDPISFADSIKDKYAAIIYLEMKSKTQVGWVLMTPNGKTANITMNPLAEQNQRIASWVDSVEENFTRLSK